MTKNKDYLQPDVYINQIVGQAPKCSKSSAGNLDVRFIFKSLVSVSENSLIEPLPDVPLPDSFVVPNAGFETIEYVYTSPSTARAVYEVPDVIQFPTYTHTEGYSNPIPTPSFIVPTVNQFPNYTHSTDLVRVASASFSADSINQFPTYVQADPTDLEFSIGNRQVIQWEKASIIAAPTGPGPFDFTVIGLPTGLSLEGLNNAFEIKGTPEVSGVFPVEITVTDRIGRSVVANFDIEVAANSQVAILENTVPDAFAEGMSGYVLGYNFGSSGSLEIDGNVVPTESWSDTEIKFIVPALSGALNIQVISNGSSNLLVRRFSS